MPSMEEIQKLLKQVCIHSDKKRQIKRTSTNKHGEYKNPNVALRHAKQQNKEVRRIRTIEITGMGRMKECVYYKLVDKSIRIIE